MVTGFQVVDRDIINKYHGVVSSPVLSAIANASKTTGADFAYLMDKASTESGFDPGAKSKGSSATGLFQFIDKTWLSMVAQHGAQHGLGDLAQKITIDDQGRPHVADPATRRHILDLRKNPAIAAAMAGEFAVDNKEYLQNKLHQAVGSAELYLAHFLGAGKAANFLKEMKENPSQVAATIFGHEATANKNVFFNKETGQPKTLEQIYAFFKSKFDGASPSSASPEPATSPVQTASADAVELAFEEKPVLTPPTAAHMPQLYKTLDSVNVMIMAQMNKTLTEVMSDTRAEQPSRYRHSDDERTAGSGFTV